MKPAGQMTVTLTPDLEKFVRDEVRKGAFASNSEYIRDVLRERYERAQNRAAKARALDEALARSLADAKAGRVAPLDETFTRLREELGLAGEDTGK